MAASEKSFSIVVSYSEDDSAEALVQTVRAFLAQEGSGKRFYLELNVWHRTANAGESTSSILETCLRGIAEGVKVYASENSFLGSFRSSLSLVGQQDPTHILLVGCGVIPKPTCIAFLLEKLSEYGETMPLTAVGCRIFPHEKVASPLQDLQAGIHYKFYTSSHSDRAVHVFTPELCCLSTATVKSLLEHQGDAELASLGHLWCSFIAGHLLGVPIWKINLEGVANLPPTDYSLAHSVASVENQSIFERFYHHSYNSNWPVGVSQVYYNPQQLRATPHDSCQCLWRRGFGGVNMLSEPASQLDFAAAASYGVRVIRIGAVGDAKDLSYLLDSKTSSAEEDEAHLLKVLPRLRRSLTTVGEHGLKVIITLVDLPGSPFLSLEDEAPMPFWENQTLRSRAAKFWGVLAKNLVDLKPLIMGYDILNEPYTPEDRDVGFFEPIPMAQQNVLHQFYCETLREIRRYDHDTAVVVKCTWFASPIAMNILQPLSDPNIKYSFHCYLPPHLTLHRNCHYSARKYPGSLPKNSWQREHKVTVDKMFFHQLLSDHVRSWQERHGIPSSQILVAEFGICREVPGAIDYLRDLVDLFREFGWSWLLFSFRDEEWDAMDYELGGDTSNMLHRSPSDMFMSVGYHFH